MEAARYLGLFVTDARDMLARLEADLVRFEQSGPDDERRILLDGIFRHLHSIKGSAAMMGLDGIAKIAHQAEQIASDARSGARALKTPEVDLLLAACDGIRALVQKTASSGGTDNGEPSADLLHRLTTAAEPAPKEAPPPEPPAQPPEGAHTAVRVSISPSCSTPAARAFIVLRKLEALGPIVASRPSVPELRAGHLPEMRIDVALAGDINFLAIREAIDRVPSIDSVEQIDFSESSAAAENAPAALTARAAPGDAAVRVSVELLDLLLEMAGELVLSSGRMRDTVAHIPPEQRVKLDDEVDRLARLVKELNNRVLATRQTPVRHLADRMPRVVRDLSRQLNKPLRFTVDGADVTLDHGMLDSLADPLMHAIRNAADHGIEPPELRKRFGKPETGTLALSVRREREKVWVELRDDGGGFDLGRLRERAVAVGALTREQAEALPDQVAIRLAFLPGLSTRDQATDISGRGVGMDAVLSAVEQLGGEVVLDSVLGAGSSVSFVLPATVSVVNLLLVDLAGEIFGVPMNRILFAAEGEVTPAMPGMVQLGNQRISAFSLGRLIGLPEQSLGPRPFVVVESDGQRSAIAVDKLLGQEEAVLRPVGPPLDRIRGIAGSAILGSGRPIFVLDMPRLIA